eukprot:569154-Rhodomonas_salina.2
MGLWTTGLWTTGLWIMRLWIEQGCVWITGLPITITGSGRGRARDLLQVLERAEHVRLQEVLCTLSTEGKHVSAASKRGGVEPQTGSVASINGSVSSMDARKGHARMVPLQIVTLWTLGT